MPDTPRSDDLSLIYQGAHLDTSAITLGNGEVLDCPDGVVVLSQTCDARLAKVQTLVVAQVSRPVANLVAAARKGESPRYIWLGHLPDGCFVDMDYVAALPKRDLSARVLGQIDVTDRAMVVELGRILGNRFSRFAFPNEVWPWLSPLEGRAKRTHPKAGSELGQALRQVAEIRVQAKEWNVAEHDLVVHFILEDGVLPDLDDPVPRSKELMKWLAQKDRDINGLAGRLAASTVPQDQAHLWGLLVEALIDECLDSGRSSAESTGTSAVSSMTAQVWSISEFTLDLYRVTEELDLGFLSAPK